MLALLPLGAATALFSIGRMQAPPTKTELPNRASSFSAPAMPAGKLIPLLAAETGLKLECGVDTASDVLLLIAKDRPIKEILQKLADADSAEWLQDGERMRFGRSAMLTARLEREETAAIEEGIRKKLAPIYETLTALLTPARALDAARQRNALRQESERSGGSDDPQKEREQERRLQRLDGVQPEFRLIGRCLQEVGVGRIAAMRTGERTVYSTRPTAMQKPLGRTITNAVTKFFAEDIVWRAAIKRLNAEERAASPPIPGEGEPAQDDEDYDSSPKYGDTTLDRSGAYGSSAETAVGRPVSVRMIFSGQSYGTYSISLAVLDERGRTVLDISSSDFLGNPDSQPDQAPADHWKGSPNVDFSPATRLFAKEYAHIISLDQSRSGPGAQKKAPPQVDPALKRILLRPETEEPLDLGPADAFRSVAKTKELSLAACLSDSLIAGETMDDERKPLKTDQFLSSIRDETDISTNGGWIVARPRHPLQCAKCRIDRAAIGDYLRSLNAQGRSSIDMEATLQSQIAEDADDTIVRTPAWILQGRLVTLRGSDPLLRLYGSLSAVQRDRLLAGGQVNYGLLNIRQRKLANRVVFGPDGASERGGSGPPAGPDDPEIEPTEVAPHGLYTQCGVRAKMTRIRRIYLVDPNKPERQQRFQVLAVDEDPGSGFSRRMYLSKTLDPASLKYELRYVNRLRVEADISPWHWIASTYHDDPVPDETGPVPLSQLPEELRRIVEEAFRARDAQRGSFPELDIFDRPQ